MSGIRPTRRLLLASVASCGGAMLPGCGMLKSTAISSSNQTVHVERGGQRFAYEVGGKPQSDQVETIQSVLSSYPNYILERLAKGDHTSGTREPRVRFFVEPPGSFHLGGTIGRYWSIDNDIYVSNEKRSTFRNDVCHELGHCISDFAVPDTDFLLFTVPRFFEDDHFATLKSHWQAQLQASKSSLFLADDIIMGYVMLKAMVDGDPQAHQMTDRMSYEYRRWADAYLVSSYFVSRYALLGKHIRDNKLRPFDADLAGEYWVEAWAAFVESPQRRAGLKAIDPWLYMAVRSYFTSASFAEAQAKCRAVFANAPEQELQAWRRQGRLSLFCQAIEALPSDPTTSSHLAALRTDLERMNEIDADSAIPDSTHATVGALVKILLDKYEADSAGDVRIGIAVGLQYLDARFLDGAAPVLIRHLGKEPQYARYGAVLALNASGSQSIESLTQTLQSPEPLVRVTAALALVRLGESHRALPIFEAELENPNEDVRKDARLGLAHIYIFAPDLFAPSLGVKAGP